MISVETVQAEVDDLEEKLSSARQRLYAAQCKAAGIFHGDIVKDRKGQIFKVAKVSSFWNHTKPSLEGYKKLKSGAFHATAFYIGNEWTKVAA